METKTYNEMEYIEINDLVKNYFPESKFNFVADEEMNNDSEKTFGKITKEDYSKWEKWDKEDWDNMIIGKPIMYRTRLYLQYFVAHDILPEGYYLITVCW